MSVTIFQFRIETLPDGQLQVKTTKGPTAELVKIYGPYNPATHQAIITQHTSAGGFVLSCSIDLLESTLAY